MGKELSYFTVSTVIDSWEVLKRKENYAENLGRIMFIKFFDRIPEAKAVFGFDTMKMKNDEDFYKSRVFLVHGKHFVLLLNRALDMLGPNLEMLTEILLDLGGTHRTKYGVKPEYFPVLGVALLESIEEMLGPKNFTDETKVCWLEVYTALTEIMTIRKNKNSTRIK